MARSSNSKYNIAKKTSVTPIRRSQKRPFKEIVMDMILLAFNDPIETAVLLGHIDKFARERELSGEHIRRAMSEYIKNAKTILKNSAIRYCVVISNIISNYAASMDTNKLIEVGNIWDQLKEMKCLGDTQLNYLRQKLQKIVDSRVEKYKNLGIFIDSDSEEDEDDISC